MPRRLAPLACGLAVLALQGLTTSAAAAGLCDRLTVPSSLELDCSVDVEDGSERAVVQPVGGTFSLLSRMSLRRLDRATDPLAWDDPAAWLERQMILDLDGVAALIRDLGADPDSPFGSSVLESALDMLAEGIEGLSRLPLNACGDGAVASELSCRFGIEPIGLNLRINLVTQGEERYAFNIRTFNEQRLRHFTAIANSFKQP